MAKSLHNDVLDAACDEIATCTRLDVCTTEPTDLTEATSTYTVGNVTLTAGDGNGDYTVGDGDTSGRKVAVAQQSITSASASGTALHIALSDGTSLLAVTSCTSQAVTSGNPITVPTFDIEFADPT
jgi:hypothetical protein